LLTIIGLHKIHPWLLCLLSTHKYLEIYGGKQMAECFMQFNSIWMAYTVMFWAFNRAYIIWMLEMGSFIFFSM